MLECGRSSLQATRKKHPTIEARNRSDAEEFGRHPTKEARPKTSPGKADASISAPANGFPSALCARIIASYIQARKTHNTDRRTQFDRSLRVDSPRHMCLATAGHARAPAVLIANDTERGSMRRAGERHAFES